MTRSLAIRVENKKAFATVLQVALQAYRPPKVWGCPIGTLKCFGTNRISLVQTILRRLKRTSVRAQSSW